MTHVIRMGTQIITVDYIQAAPSVSAFLQDFVFVGSLGPYQPTVQSTLCKRVYGARKERGILRIPNPTPRVSKPV